MTLVIGFLKISPFLLSLLASFAVSPFLFWRNLKDEYKEEEIFNLIILAILLSIFTSRLFYVIENFARFNFSLNQWIFLNHGHNFSFSGAFLGVALTIYWQTKKNKKNPWEALDAMILPFFCFSFLSSFGLFLSSFNYVNLFYVLISFLLIIIFPEIKKRYRSLSWYKSGKTGFLFTVFSGGAFLLCFLFALALAFFKKSGIYLEHWIWLMFFLISLGLLYYRSERNFKDDFLGIFKRRKK